MQDYGLSAAQRQYDNAEPPRYNRKPVYNCYYCGSEIYRGEKCAVICGVYNCCADCFSVNIAEEEQ